MDEVYADVRAKNEIYQEVIAAQKKIYQYVRETPLDYSISLSKQHQLAIYLKCENLQYTGAFKVRGAFNKLMSLTEEERRIGIVTASSGNHGAAVAFGASTFTIPGIIFVPENVSPTKVENIRNYNIPLEFFGTDTGQTESHAIEYATKHHKIYVSPYNDIKIIAGQGTIGAEIYKQLKDIDAVFVPIGGGGLISGIAGYLKAVLPQIKIIGCSPENSPVMIKSQQAGKILDIPVYPTLSDGTKGGLEPDSITFKFCQSYVDDYVLVSEDEIKDAMLSLMKTQHMMIEGASGVALAAIIKLKEKFIGKKVVAVLSGANISIETLKKVITS